MHSLRVYWEKLVEIDASTALAYQAKARVLWQYDRAIEQTNKALALDPGQASPGVLWLAYIETGREEEAIEAFFNSRRSEKVSEERISALKQGLEKSGTNALWHSILERQLNRGIAILIASTYARLGEKDEAFSLTTR